MLVCVPASSGKAVSPKGFFTVGLAGVYSLVFCAHWLTLASVSVWAPDFTYLLIQRFMSFRAGPYSFFMM